MVPRSLITTECPAQAEVVLKAAEGSVMFAYIVVPLLTGARTEELRALTWGHVDLKGGPKGQPTRTAPHRGMAFRPTRRDTKTRKSRRTLAPPKR